VNLTLKIKINTRTCLLKENHNFSKIISLEKKPVENTSPINLISLKIDLHKIKGEKKPLFEY